MSILKLDDLEICMFSFNLGNYNDSDYKKYDKITKDFAKLFKTNDNRIWVISTQEDKSNSLFIENLIKFFGEHNKNHMPLANYGTNTEHGIFAAPASFKNKIVKLLVFIPSRLNGKISVYNIKLVKHSHAFNKSSLILSLKINSSDGIVMLNLIASHLPINTKEDIMLGVELRKTAMLDCLTKLNKIINIFKKLNQNSSIHILWTGDLNFRVEEFGNPKSDQLKKFLENDTSVNVLNNVSNTVLISQLKDFTPIDFIAPTCKTISNSTQINNNNNKAPLLPTNNNNNNSNTTPLLQNNNNNNNNKQKRTKNLCQDVYLHKSTNTDNISKCYDIITKTKKAQQRLNTHSNTLKSKLLKQTKQQLQIYINKSTKISSCKKNIEQKQINKLSPCLELLKIRQNMHESSIIRYPSYCDRIIGYSSSNSGVVLEPYFIKDLDIDSDIDSDIQQLPVRPVISLDFISVSDHNPILGTFKFKQYKSTQNKLSINNLSILGNGFPVSNVL